MKMVVLPASAATEAVLHALEAEAGHSFEKTCTAVAAGGTITAMEDACYELTFDAAVDTSTFTILTGGNAAIAIFTAHLPTEFEADTHYLQYSGTDIEPVTVVVPGQVYGIFTPDQILLPRFAFNPHF